MANRLTIPSEASSGYHYPGWSVAEGAARRLRDSSYSALRTLSCQYQDGVLVLRGELGSYYLKQVAQVTVAQLEGVERVENQIEVHFVRPSYSTAELEQPQPLDTEACYAQFADTWTTI